MLDEEKCFKAINFDLDTKALQQYYPSTNWRKAYDDINKFLISNGFEHRQGSGYVSKLPIKNTTIIAQIQNLSKTFSWISKCINRLDVTNIGNSFDMVDIIKDASLENDIDNISLSEKNEYIAKLNEIEQIANKIQDAIDYGELDIDKDNRSVGQER